MTLLLSRQENSLWKLQVSLFVLKQKDLITKTRLHIAWPIVSTVSPEHYMMWGTVSNNKKLFFVMSESL